MSAEIELIPQEGVFYISSRIVAPMVGKPHKEVLEAGRKLMCDLEEIEKTTNATKCGRRKFPPAFLPWKEPDAQKKLRDTVLMSRDGFQMFVGGLQGKKYLPLKIKVSRRFEECESVKSTKMLSSAKKQSIPSFAAVLRGTSGIDLDTEEGLQEACDLYEEVLNNHPHVQNTDKSLLRKISNADKGIFNRPLYVHLYNCRNPDRPIA